MSQEMALETSLVTEALLTDVTLVCLTLLVLNGQVVL